MANVSKRGAKEGIVFGLLAGIVFAIMEVVGAAMMGKATARRPSDRRARSAVVRGALPMVA